MIQWYIFAIGSVVFKTLFEITRKKALSNSHAMCFESLRSFFVAIFCLFLVPFIDFSFDKTALIWVYIVSLLATIGILYAAKAFRHKDISLISPLDNLRPAFAAILALIFLSEALDTKQIGGIFLLLVSTYLLESDHHFSDFIAPIKNLVKSKYSIYFIFATLIFAISAVLDKFILASKINNIFTYFFFIWIFLAINFNIIHLYKFGIKDTINCAKSLKFSIITVAILSVASNLLAYKAISLTYVSLVMPVLMLSNFFIVLFGGKFFHERYLSFRLIISSVMLIGVYLIIT